MSRGRGLLRLALGTGLMIGALAGFLGMVAGALPAGVLGSLLGYAVFLAGMVLAATGILARARTGGQAD